MDLAAGWIWLRSAAKSQLDLCCRSSWDLAAESSQIPAQKEKVPAPRNGGDHDRNARLDLHEVLAAVHGAEGRVVGDRRSVRRPARLLDEHLARSG